MSKNILSELSLNPRELAGEISAMIFQTTDEHTLHVLAHMYAVVSTIADMFPDRYPNSWEEHMSGVIELNRMAKVLIRENKQKHARITALSRRIEDLRAELNAKQHEIDAMHRMMIRTDNGGPFVPRKRKEGLPS